jgi:hypothetical protein
MNVILICCLWFHHSSVAAADLKSPKDEKGKLFSGVQLIVLFLPRS